MSKLSKAIIGRKVLFTDQFFSVTVSKQTSLTMLRNEYLILFNRVDIVQLLTVNNVYRLHALKFTLLWHKNLLPTNFRDFFNSSMLTIYMLIIPDTPLAKTSTNRQSERTGKQSISYMASVFWNDTPSYLKNLNVFQFCKQIKVYLLFKQLASK